MTICPRAERLFAPDIYVWQTVKVGWNEVQMGIGGCCPWVTREPLGCDTEGKKEQPEKVMAKAEHGQGQGPKE